MMFEFYIPASSSSFSSQYKPRAHLVSQESPPEPEQGSEIGGNQNSSSPTHVFQFDSSMC